MRVGPNWLGPLIVRLSLIYSNYKQLNQDDLQFKCYLNGFFSSLELFEAVIDITIVRKKAWIEATCCASFSTNARAFDAISTELEEM